MFNVIRKFEVCSMRTNYGIMTLEKEDDENLYLRQDGTDYMYVLQIEDTSVEGDYSGILYKDGKTLEKVDVILDEELQISDDDDFESDEEESPRICKLDYLSGM